MLNFICVRGSCTHELFSSAINQNLDLHMINDNSTTKVLSLLLKELQIPVTRESIINELQKHPDLFSLRVISDILDHWNITNAAYAVTIKELQETEIPLPFIACFKKGEFVLVKRINEKGAVVSNDRWDNHELPINEFIELYQGTILAFQKDELSGEKDYAVKRRKEIVNNFRIPFVVFGFVTILILFLLLNPFYFKAFNWHIGLLSLFKTAGLGVSILLLIQSIDKNNPFVQKLCGSDDSKNCNAILAAKAAKVTEELSWSEVGFFYFAGTWLALLFNTTNGHLIQILAILNLISLPYTFYSIYYQWRVARQWCVFCCAAQAILWLEFFAFFTFLRSPLVLPVDFQVWGSLVAAIFFPILLWVFIKPYLMNSEHLKVLKPELYRFKYNKELFKDTIEKQVKYGLLPDENTITVGNQEADNIITVVSSPFCHACSNVHKVLDEFVDGRDDVKLQFIFLTRISSKEFDRKVLSHFMGLKSRYDDFSVKKALNDWYKQKKKDYDSWQVGYPVNEVIDKSDVLVKQKAWCKMANVTSTPTIFVNGRRLPEMYRAEDIEYIL